MAEKMTVDEALDLYFKKFKKDYPLHITSMIPEDEVIKDILRCIKHGKKKPEEDDDGGGVLY